jgi:hypothetical protein
MHQIFSRRVDPYKSSSGIQEPEQIIMSEGIFLNCLTDQLFNSEA